MYWELIQQAVQAQAAHTIEAGGIVVAVITLLARFGLDPAKLPQRWQPAPSIVLTAVLLLLFARDDGLPWWLASVVAVVNGLLGGLGAIGTYHAVRKVAKGGPGGAMTRLERGPDAEAPHTPRVVGGLFLVLLVGSCAGSFEEARIAGVQARAVSRAEPPSGYCQGLDSQRRRWGGIGQGAAALAGAQGLGVAALEAWGDRPKVELGLAIGTATLSAGAVAAAWVSHDAGETWVRDCGVRGL